MEFEDAGDLECLRAESWFRAGDLSFSRDAKHSFICFREQINKPKTDDLCSPGEHDFDRFRLWFELRRNVPSRQPKTCMPIMVASSPQKHLEQLSQIRGQISEVEVPFFAPRRELEEIFGVTGDPESLDDSYIVELLGNSQPGDTSNKFEERLDEIDLYSSYLLVSPKSIYKAGDPYQTLIKHDITDCQIFNTLPGKLGSLILIATSSGYILSVIMDVGSFKSAIIQYWKLGSAGQWSIVKHKSEEQFVAVNRKEGLCKFFRFRDPLHFMLVNNLSIDNAQFLDCSFFPNSSHSHYLLFVPSIRYRRVVLFCIEWDTTAPEMKEVYQLTYLKGQLIDCCVPVGNNRSLIFSNDEIFLVSAHQIMSGETNFKHFQLRLFKGICSFFEAPQLLMRLKSIHGELFANFHYCTLLATFSGNIAICVMDEHDEIKFYSLTRFKGLKNVSPVFSQKSTGKEYEVVVISFGRTLQLTIDISNLKPLSDDSLIPSLNGICLKHTLDSSTEDNSGLLIISPPKCTSRFLSEIWLTSSMAISHLQTFAPVRKLRQTYKLRRFQLFNKMKVFNFSHLKHEVIETLSQGMDLQDSQLYLVIATDSISMSRAFLLSLCSPQVTVVELDDLLQDVAGDTIDAFFSQKGSLVQITKEAVYVDSFGSSIGEQTMKFTPGWKLQGVAFCKNKVMIWSSRERKLSFINDIDELGRTEDFTACPYFENKMKGNCCKKVDFCIAQVKSGTVFIYMASNAGVSRYTWDILCSSSVASEKCEVLCYECSDSLLPFNNQLYFVRNESEVVKADHHGLSTMEVQLKYNTKDVQIRAFNENSCLVFSTQEITVFSTQTTNGEDSEVYELKLPPQSRANPILDVSVDAENNRIFVLYSDGVEIFDLSYFTWNSSNYLLRSTKTSNKKLIFIEKLNRMLVVNLRAREWDCIKLVDGKSLSLDPSTLQSPENQSIVDVVEIPTEKKYVQLLLHFNSLIKLVRLVPKRGRIIVEEISKYGFSTPLFDHIEVSKAGTFLVFLPSSSLSSNGSSECFMQMQVNQEDKLEVVSSLNFPEQMNLRSFRLCGKDVVIVSNSYDRVFLLKDFPRLLSQKRLQAISLKMPLASRILIVCPLDCDSFVVAVSCEGRSDHITELLFYHRDDAVLSHETTEDSSGDNLLHEAAILDDVQRQDESETYRFREEDDNEDITNDDEDMTSISAAGAGGDWDINYRDFLHRMANGRLGRGEEWDFDDLDMEYEVGEDDEVGQESEEDEDMLDTDDMDEMDEYDAFERPANSNLPLDLGPELSDDHTSSHQISSKNLVRPVSASIRRKPYQVVSLDKGIKDLQYDRMTGALYVLTMDSSVLVLTQTSKEVAMQSIVTENLCEPAAGSSAPRTTESGLFALDTEGQALELPWL